jgi:hypothetical protein
VTLGPEHYFPMFGVVAQVVGLVLLIVFALTWNFTGRESVLLVGAAGSLILLGRYERARIEVARVAAPERSRE